MIKVGDRVPKGVLKTLTEDGVIDLSTEAIFAGKKVVQLISEAAVRSARAQRVNVNLLHGVSI